MKHTMRGLAAALGWLAVVGCSEDDAIEPNDGGASSSSSSSSGGTSSSSSGGSSTSGSSSGGSSSGSSSGDASTCTAIGTGDFVLGDFAPGELVQFFGRMQPTFGTETDSVLLTLFGPTANAAGTFDLAAGDDANFSTCVHCAFAVTGPQEASTIFYQTGGTLTLDAEPDAYGGGIHATLTDLTMVEVTLDEQTLVSTPVPGGKCLTVASATLDVAPPPVAPDTWTCDPAFYADSVCDCACGAPDLDCAADATVDTCATCDACGTPAQCKDRVDPANLAACAATGEPDTWTCDRFAYDDGVTCDCGCGAFDPDCDSAAVGACDSCAACGTAGCELIVEAADNAQCKAPPAAPAAWTCNPKYFADGDCDCACGALDIDCGESPTAATCDYCTACDPAAGVACSAVVTPDLLACAP